MKLYTTGTDTIRPVTPGSCLSCGWPQPRNIGKGNVRCDHCETTYRNPPTVVTRKPEPQRRKVTRGGRYEANRAKMQERATENSKLFDDVMNEARGLRFVDELPPR